MVIFQSTAKHSKKEKKRRKKRMMLLDDVVDGPSDLQVELR
jgi:hypothetical protein